MVYTIICFRVLDSKFRKRVVAGKVSRCESLSKKDIINQCKFVYMKRAIQGKAI